MKIEILGLRTWSSYFCITYEILGLDNGNLDVMNKKVADLLKYIPYTKAFRKFAIIRVWLDVTDNWKKNSCMAADTVFPFFLTIQTAMV